VFACAKIYLHFGMSLNHIMLTVLERNVIVFSRYQRNVNITEHGPRSRTGYQRYFSIIEIDSLKHSYPYFF